MNEYQKAKLEVGINAGLFAPASAFAAVNNMRHALKPMSENKLWLLNAVATGAGAGGLNSSIRNSAEAFGQLKKIKAIAKAKGISRNDVTKEDIKNYN